MVRTLTIDNFKGFNQETIIDFSELTLLSGLNSSGKSSAYQALIALSQSLQDVQITEKSKLPIFCTYGNKLKLGTIEDIINDLSRPMKLQLDFDKMHVYYSYQVIENHIILTEVAVENFSEEDPYFYRLKFDLESKKIKVDAENCLRFVDYEMDSIIGKYLQTEKIVEDAQQQFYSSIVCFDSVYGTVFSRNQLRFFNVDFQQVINCIEPSLRSKINNLHFTKHLEEQFLKLEKQEASLYVSGMGLRTEFLELNYVPPYRGIPQRYYDVAEGEDGGVNGELLSAINTNRKIPYRFQKNNKKIFGDSLVALNYWTKEILGIDGIEQDSKLEGVISSLMILQDGKKYSINMVGYGVSQALPIILNILFSDSQLCIIDEPEIHLHPKAQVQFAKFFYEMARLGKQIIVETHSEYIINYLIYESLISTSNSIVKMYWVKKGETGSFIDLIRWDKFGFIKNRPKGFSDGMEDIVKKMIDFRTQVK
ncbi:AAA family ATPase [uncultured Sphaerochaeta sp.]|uniref:AAA family ATPase n=1 Tax=uncultured Sphaerochaeta sp. TaxID=886478 RepID=UPI0029CAA344|nr:AAA family ATPase [uncultured Sphaerochaeta sp.]